MNRKTHTSKSYVQDMAFKIADSAARSDIECNCLPDRWEGPDGRWWNLNTAAPDAKENIEDAAGYLGARDLIRYHPGHPNLVQFTKPIVGEERP